MFFTPNFPLCFLSYLISQSFDSHLFLIQDTQDKDYQEDGLLVTGNSLNNLQSKKSLKTLRLTVGSNSRPVTN